MDPKGGKHALDDHGALLTEIADDLKGQVVLVWTPDHEFPVLPEELVGEQAAESVRLGRARRYEQDLERSRPPMIWGSLIAAAWILHELHSSWMRLAWLDGMERIIAAARSALSSIPVGFCLLLWLIFALIPWHQARSQMHVWREVHGGDSAALIPTLRFETWMGMQRAVVTRLITVLLVVVFLCQYGTGEGDVAAAGLVKAAYHSGEVWRLLTAPWLHGNLLHLIFNALAMLYLGKRVETLARWPHLLGVLLFASLAGGIMSALLHDHASVGISGGLMGWLGFLLVFETLHKRLVTLSARRHLVLGLVVTVIMGFVGYRFIDNAAHLGGLLAGMTYAGIVFPSSVSIHRPRVLPVDLVAGALSALILMMGVVLAVVKLFSGS